MPKLAAGSLACVRVGMPPVHRPLSRMPRRALRNEPAICVHESHCCVIASDGMIRNIQGVSLPLGAPKLEVPSLVDTKPHAVTHGLSAKVSARQAAQLITK